MQENENIFFLLLDEDILSGINFHPQIKVYDDGMILYDDKDNIILYKIVYQRNKEIIYYEDYAGNWYDKRYLKIPPDYIGRHNFVKSELLMENDDTIILKLNNNIIINKVMDAIEAHLTPILLSDNQAYREYNYVKSVKVDAQTLLIHYRENKHKFKEDRISLNPPALRVHGSNRYTRFR